MRTITRIKGWDDQRGFGPRDRQLSPPRSWDSDSAGLRVISYLGDIEFQRFSVDLVIDSNSSWEAGYAKVAATVPHLVPPTATEALEIVRALLEPLLGNQPNSGHWNPTRRRWS